MLNPIAFAANNNMDNLYYHQAIKEPVSRDFQKDITKKFNDHIKQKNWEITTREQVTKGEQILPYICSFKRNRNIKTKRVL